MWVDSLICVVMMFEKAIFQPSLARLTIEWGVSNELCCHCQFWEAL